MTAGPREPWLLRRGWLAGLTALALLMVALVIYSTLADDDAALVFDETWHSNPPLPVESPPNLEFPERLRSFDSSLNRFIDRFIRTTRAGAYDEFRKMWTRRLDPVSADGYALIWTRVRSARVVDLRKAHPDSPDPAAYLVAAHVTIEETGSGRATASGPTLRQRTYRLLVVKEDGDWRFAPVPPRAAPQGPAS